MSTAQDLISLLKNRRTYYALSASSPIPDAQIESIVKDILLQSPSSFNSQSTRVLILFKEDHVKLWEFAKEAIKAIVPAEAYPASEQRLNGFQKGYGTVLFFDDRTTISSFQEKFALYADKFPTWAQHSSGFTQIAIWTALEAEGLGANLQHYNPLIDQKVADTWGISKDWELTAQLVFGKKEGEPGEKSYIPIEERVKVSGA